MNSRCSPAPGMLVALPQICLCSPALGSFNLGQMIQHQRWELDSRLPCGGRAQQDPCCFSLAKVSCYDARWRAHPTQHIFLQSCMADARCERP